METVFHTVFGVLQAGKIRSEINKLEKKKDDMEVSIQAQYKVRF